MRSACVFTQPLTPDFYGLHVYLSLIPTLNCYFVSENMFLELLCRSARILCINSTTSFSLWYPVFTFLLLLANSSHYPCLDRMSAEREKKLVFLTARVHPGESPASFVCQGKVLMWGHWFKCRTTHLCAQQRMSAMHVYILLLVTRMFIATVDSCFTSLFQKFKIIVARPEN